MIHFTHTGPYAGLPFCEPKTVIQDKDKEATFVHPGYGIFSKDEYIRAAVKDGMVCPVCGDIWFNPDGNEEA